MILEFELQIRIAFLSRSFRFAEWDNGITASIFYMRLIAVHLKVKLSCYRCERQRKEPLELILKFQFLCEESKTDLLGKIGLWQINSL